MLAAGWRHWLDRSCSQWRRLLEFPLGHKIMFQNPNVLLDFSNYGSVDDWTQVTVILHFFFAFFTRFFLVTRRRMSVHQLKYILINLMHSNWSFFYGMIGGAIIFLPKNWKPKFWPWNQTFDNFLNPKAQHFDP